MRINSSNHPIKAAVAQNISVKQGGPEISGTVKDQPDDFGGLLLGMAAFFIWGLFPLYFYFLKGVPPLVTVAFRIVFAMVFLIPLILYNGKLRLVFAIFRMPKMFFTLILSSLLNCGCIGMFVWLVVTDRTLYSSLSSYIGPLMTVFIGFLAFRERFSFQTWLAIIFA
ncbi:MAG: EamA family transporter, partial [Thermoguttaceae bacterium]|nr:EamA family transporter [Thermoguttaceae bacterium]